MVDNVENIRSAGWVGGQPAVILDIMRQPGANIIQTADRVKALLPRLRASIPPAVKVSILTDRTNTIRASIRDVQFTLVLTVALVVMVIFVFLRKFWATVIPSVALPLAVIGTFGIMKLIGFSLDNLSLMALTIATGFVVDDAIVMIENIVRFIEMGEPPLAAALKGAKQIGFTVISLSISLIAVFIPLLFMTGIVGRLFREFAITLSVAVAVSAVVSLTLTPMMCARLLRQPEDPKVQTGGFIISRNECFKACSVATSVGLKWVLRHQLFTLLVAIGTLVATIWLYVFIPKGLLPQQDTGVIIGVTDTAQSISFQADGLAPARHRGNRHAQGSRCGQRRLLRWRRHHQPDRQHWQALYRLSNRATNAPPTPAKSSTACAKPPAMFRESPSSCRPSRTSKLTAASAAPNTNTPWRTRTRTNSRNGRPNCWPSSATCPELADVASDQQSGGLQISIVVDRDAASRLNLVQQTIDDTLYDAFGQRQISTIFTQLNQYRVILEAEPNFQLRPRSPWTRFTSSPPPARWCRSARSPTSAR